MNRIANLSFVVALCLPLAAQAEADLKANTPAITAIKQNLRSRHEQIEHYLESGAIGLTGDGMVVVHDIAVVPLAERAVVNSLVAADNQDRAALYREIAVANGHPEWEGEVRSTFAQRWIGRARSGWWYQGADGAWARK